MNRRNPSKVQLKAIMCGNGPVRVLAGPGSGKTFTIIHRILYLIQKQGVSPGEILTVTFTKAAAEEMQGRYRHENPGKPHSPSAETVSFGTLHGICYHILNSYGKINRFSLIKESEKRKIAEVILQNTESTGNRFRKNNLYDFVTEFLNEVSRHKNGLSQKEDSIFQKLFSEYQSYLFQRRLLDFDDIILQCKNILEEDASFCQSLQKRFRYLLVDEFQDINEIQYQVIKLLAGPENNLFVVGDDDQSIYGFRGSYPGIMERFLWDFPMALSFTLNENYRCAEAITALSGRVILRNKNRIPKALQAVKSGGCVKSFFAKTRREEEQRLLEKIRSFCIHQSKDCAVIVRTNLEAGIYSSLLKKNGIPVWEKQSKQNLFHHYITEDVSAFLRFLKEGRKRADFLRFMNKPERYLSEYALREETVTLDGLLGYYRNHPPMQEELKKLFSQLATAEALSPHLAIRYFKEIMGYEKYLSEEKKRHKRTEPPEYAEKLLGEIQTLFRSIREGETVRDFLARKEEEASLEENSLRDKAQDSFKENRQSVRILTMHGAKGLEFDTVFLPDLNEGVIPGRNCKTKEALEEERRLLYVAITRARNNLFLYYTGERNRPLTSFLEGIIPPHR